MGRGVIPLPRQIAPEEIESEDDGKGLTPDEERTLKRLQVGLRSCWYCSFRWLSLQKKKAKVALRRQNLVSAEGDADKN